MYLWFFGSLDLIHINFIRKIIWFFAYFTIKARTIGEVEKDCEIKLCSHSTANTANKIFRNSLSFQYNVEINP